MCIRDRGNTLLLSALNYSCTKVLRKLGISTIEEALCLFCCDLNEALAKMIPKAHEMGVKEGFDPFITLSFMALEIKGLQRVFKFKKDSKELVLSCLLYTSRCV